VGSRGRKLGLPNLIYSFLLFTTAYDLLPTPFFKSMINLEDYYIVYQITCIPIVLYSKLVTASEYVKFDQFYLPPELESHFMECNFILFDKAGNLVEFSHNVATKLNLTSTINNVPLKMIKNLLAQNE